MTVNLTRIYTKLGDGGDTHLGDMSRVSKLDPRVEAYGTVDELNATLGVALLAPGLSPSVRRLAAPRAERPARPRRRPLGARAARGRLRRRQERARAAAHRPRLHGVARAGLRRGQRDARAAALVRDPRRHARLRAPARLPHGLPPRRAPRDRRRRGDQPRGRALPEPALGPALHPRPRRQPRPTSPSGVQSRPSSRAGSAVPESAPPGAEPSGSESARAWVRGA